MKFLQLIAVTAFLVSSVFTNIHSQKMPYPQSKNWNNCIKPKSVSQALMNQQIAQYYDYWKEKYLTESSSVTDGYYAKSAGTGGSGKDLLTVSEAHGYAMIITALMGGYDPDAEKYFDGLYAFFDSRRANNDELMAWAIAQGEGAESNGSATDGDLDIAYALILAYHQWGYEEYLKEAKTMIEDGIRANEMASDGTVLLGDWVNNGNDTRPSDWMTAHFHTFKDISGDSFWNNAADKAYSIYSAFTANSDNDAGTTGLISDFVVNGDEACDAYFLGEYELTNTFNFNACRVPWRIAMDYGHYGESKAKGICDKITGWLKGATDNDPRKIAIGYKLDGSPIIDTATSMAYSGPLVAACVTNSNNQDYLNKGWYAIYGDTYEIHHFEVAVNLLSMLFISGNWWKPGQSNTQAKEPVVKKEGVILDDFDDYYGDDPAQGYLGAAYGHHEVDEPGLGGGFWYGYYDEIGGKVTGKDNVLINDSNTNEMVVNNELHVDMITSTSDMSNNNYGYAGVAIPFLRKGGKYYDFSTLSGVTMRMKGSGKIRVELRTKDIDTGAQNEDEKWGYYGFELNLTSSYKLYQISTDYFLPQSYSPAEGRGWGWEHGKMGVNEILISVRDSAKDVELYIDSLFLNGLDYKDIFGFVPQITGNKNGVSNNLYTNSLTTQYNPQTQVVSLSYSLDKNSNVAISIYNTKGCLVSKLVNKQMVAGSHTCSIDLKSKIVSSGVYFVTATLGDKHFNEKLNLVK